MQRGRHNGNAPADHMSKSTTACEYKLAHPVQRRQVRLPRMKRGRAKADQARGERPSTRAGTGRNMIWAGRGRV